MDVLFTIGNTPYYANDFYIFLCVIGVMIVGFVAGMLVQTIKHHNKQRTPEEILLEASDMLHAHEAQGNDLPETVDDLWARMTDIIEAMKKEDI